jgi:glycosyltransferase involved in cell wall biosynthesis
MKKVAIMTHFPANQVGGIERYNHYLRQLLEANGFLVEIYCLKDIQYSFFKKAARKFVPMISQYYFLSQLIKNRMQEYDFIITNNFAGGMLRTGKTDVYNISHGVYAAGLNKLKETDNTLKITSDIRMNLLLEKSSRTGKKGIIAVSMSVKDNLLKYCGIDSTVINNCVDINHFKKINNFRELRNKYGIGEREVVGLYAGRWSNLDKRVHFLLNVINRRKDIKWVIATDTKINLKKYRNIILLNNIDYNQMPEIYSIANFAIQLSIHEGFSYFLLESISCSLPVITTKVGGTDEVFVEPPLKKLLLQSWHNDEHFYEEINNNINYLINNKDYYIYVSKRLRELVEERFSIDIWRRKIAAYLCINNN